MAAVATFTYNGTDTITAHITGATTGHTIGVYVQDDDYAFHDFTVAPSASFDIVYPPVGCSPSAPRFVYAWDQDDGNAVIGVTVFDISSGEAGEYVFEATWNFDGVQTVTVTIDTAASEVVGLDTSIGDFDEFHTAHATSPGGSFMVTLPTAVHTEKFFANVYRFTGSPYEVWSTRIFTPGVAGEGELGNPLGADAVVTEAPSGVTTTTAVLQGEVNPEGVSSTAFFEYGLTTAYGETTPAQSIGSGSDPVSVEQFIDGLRAGRTYHCRVVRNP